MRPARRIRLSRSTGATAGSRYSTSVRRGSLLAAAHARGIDRWRRSSDEPCASQTRRAHSRSRAEGGARLPRWHIRTSRARLARTLFWTWGQGLEKGSASRNRGAVLASCAQPGLIGWKVLVTRGTAQQDFNDIAIRSRMAGLFEDHGLSVVRATGPWQSVDGVQLVRAVVQRLLIGPLLSSLAPDPAALAVSVRVSARAPRFRRRARAESQTSEIQRQLFRRGYRRACVCCPDRPMHAAGRESFGTSPVARLGKDAVTAAQRAPAARVTAKPYQAALLSPTRYTEKRGSRQSCRMIAHEWSNSFMSCATTRRAARRSEQRNRRRANHLRG